MVLKILKNGWTFSPRDGTKRMSILYKKNTMEAENHGVFSTNSNISVC